jgi:hypothetical protein
MHRSVAVSLRLITVFILAALSIHAQVPGPTYEQLVGPSATQGTEFWIAIPPNEVEGYPQIGLEIYVASAFDTEVTVFDAATGKRYTKTIKKGEIRTLTDTRDETNWAWEIRNEEQPEVKGIRLTSKKPIGVYVINSKVYTSDGYLAIPTKLWGTDYRCVSYYDFREARDWAGGFVVVAKENGTEVTIDLKGVGAADAKTKGGRTINTGQPFTITLDEGQTYMVHGTGATRALFDLTGTHITSSKPVGLIGFHQRTTMPNLLMNGNGRNHLIEMLPPVNTWGKTYTTVELTRAHLTTGRGDMFRVVAAEPSTLVTYQYFDKTTKAKLGGSSFMLENAGDFKDVAQSAEPIALPEGTSVWTADKPIFVMQYSCSSSWDGDLTLDPFMLNVTPVEQFTKQTVLQQPTLTAFSSHKLNLIVQTDTSSSDLIDNLKSLNIDGVPCWNDSRAISPKLLSNRIPGTDLYWTSIEFGPTASSHIVTGNGNVKFGGYIYGYGQTDAYGWPAAAIMDNLQDTTIDTLAPVISTSGTPESAVISLTELRVAADPTVPTPFAVDPNASGIAEIDLVSNRPGKVSTNYQISGGAGLYFARHNAPKSTTFTLSVIDRKKNAVAYYYVMDWAGNVRYDSLRYIHVPQPIDTLRPLFSSKKGSPKILTVTATEARNNPNPPRPEPLDGDQVESGLAHIGLVLGDPLRTPVNYDLVYITDTTVNVTPSYKLFTFMLKVQDTTLPAKAYYSAIDHEHNFVIDSVSYTPTITTSVDVVAEPEPFTLAAFPQPATTECRVQWTNASASAGSMRLLDMQGRLVWQGTVAAGQQGATIDVAVLARGTYVLAVTIGADAATMLVRVK